MTSDDFVHMRRVMVESHLRTSGVTNAWVLAVMGSVPREDFVPDAMRATAYMDRSITLPDGGVLNPPVATALMLQSAGIGPDDRVLLIGPATAYTAALLSTRAHVDTTTGPEAINGVYTLIFIDGAVEYLPDSVIAATSENGRIVTGVIERGVTSLATGIVRDGKIALRSFADSEIVPLAAFARKKEFVF